MGICSLLLTPHCPGDMTPAHGPAVRYQYVAAPLKAEAGAGDALQGQWGGGRNGKEISVQSCCSQLWRILPAVLQKPSGSKAGWEPMPTACPMHRSDRCRFPLPTRSVGSGGEPPCPSPQQAAGRSGGSRLQTQVHKPGRQGPTPAGLGEQGLWVEGVRGTSKAVAGGGRGETLANFGSYIRKCDFFCREFVIFNQGKAGSLVFRNWFNT